MQQDTTKTLFQSTRRFLSGTLLSRFTGLARDIAMAAAFGTGASISAFLVAFRLAHLFRRLLGEGSLQTAFTPQFENLRQECGEKASHFFKSLNILLTGLLVILIIASMSILGIVLLFADISPGTFEIVKLTFLMVPSLLFICLYGLNAALLQCERYFFLPSVAPAAFNLVWILGVLALWNMPTEEAMPWLAGWIILACAAQWAMTLPRTIALVKQHGDISLQFSGTLFTPEIKNLIKALSMALIGLSASQINNALDSIFARYADAEGPAYLWYAIRMQQLPLALFGVALSGALLPPLTRAIKNGDRASYVHFLDYSLKKTVLFLLPVTVGIFLVGDISIELLYGRGEFLAESTIGTTFCLWAYGIGLIPMGLILILSPAFYAREDFKTPVAASVGSMVLNLVLNAILVLGFGLGAASVAVATSVSAWLNALWLGYSLKKAAGSYTASDFYPEIFKTMLATAGGTAALIAVDLLVWGKFSPWSVGLHQAYLMHSSHFEVLIHLLSQCVAFTAIFGIMTRLQGKKSLYCLFK